MRKCRVVSYGHVAYSPTVLAWMGCRHARACSRDIAAHGARRGSAMVQYSSILCCHHTCTLVFICLNSSHTVIERFARPLNSMVRVAKKRNPATSWPSLGLIGWMCVRRNNVAVTKAMKTTWSTLALYTTRLRFISKNSLCINAFIRPSAAGHNSFIGCSGRSLCEC